MSDLTQKVCAVVADVCDLGRDAVMLDTPFNDYGIDSLKRVELAAALEGAFDIEISSDVAERLTSVGAVVQEIEMQSCAADGETEAPEPRADWGRVSPASKTTACTGG